MTDIASLGFDVDSSGLKQGSASLDDLTNSSKRAEAASKALSAATKNASAAAVAAARSAYQESVAKTAAARAAENASKGDIQTAMAAQRRAKAALETARAEYAKVAASQAAAAASEKAAAASKAAASAQQSEASASQRAAAAMNDNARRMGGSMSGLAAQFQDIGVTASMGMNPAIIALQQGTQIAGQMEMAMQSGASAAGVLGQAFRSLFSPLTFITIGLTALAAAGLQMIDWASVGEAALNGIASVLETIAPYAAGAAAGLALLYAPAILSGLAAAATSIGTVATAAKGLAVAIYATVGLPALLVAGLVAVVAAAVTFRDELASILGVDIVGIAKNAANLVIGSFVAAYEDIRFVWNNFGSLMGAAVIGGVNIAIRAIDGLIKKATQGIDWLIEKVNPYLEMGGMDPIQQLSGRFELKELANPYADEVEKAVGERNKAVQDALSRDYLGEIGGAISHGASAAADKLRELADGLGETTKAKKKAKTEAEKLAEKYNDILLSSESFIASQMAERDALGLSRESAAALRFEQEMINKAIEAGIKLTPAMTAEIRSYAAAMAEAEQELKATRLQQDLLFERSQLGRSSVDQKIASTMRGAGLDIDFSSPVADAIRFNEQLSNTRDLLEGIASDITSGIKDALADGKLEWAELGNIAMSVLQRIADKLIEMATDQLISSLISMVTGGIGGGFGGGISSTAMSAVMGGAGGLYANGAAFSQGNVIPFANGGVVSSATMFPMSGGRTGVMGEAGAEAIMPLKRGPDGRLGVSAPKGASAPSQNTYAPTYNIDASNSANPEETRRQVTSALKEYDKGNYQRWLSAQAQARKRNAA